MTPEALHELEFVACDVIQFIKQVPELQSSKLAVIGGLALWHYLRDGRPTDNINFITNISTPPSAIKKRLLEFHNSPFIQRSQVLFYQNSSAREIRIDITPEWLSPYLPSAARGVREIPYGEVPYISAVDLIIFKLDSSGLRSNVAKKRRDAADATALLEYAILNDLFRPRNLSDRQREVADEALIDVVRFGTKTRGWWEARLGLNAPRDSEDGINYFYDEGDDALDEDRMYDSADGDDETTASDAWYYERLDHTHLRRINSLRSSRDGHTGSQPLRHPRLMRLSTWDGASCGAPHSYLPSDHAVGAGVGESSSTAASGGHITRKRRLSRNSVTPSVSRTGSMRRSSPHTTSYSRFRALSASSSNGSAMSYDSGYASVGAVAGVCHADYDNGEEEEAYYYLESAAGPFAEPGGIVHNGHSNPMSSIMPASPGDYFAENFWPPWSITPDGKDRIFQGEEGMQCEEPLPVRPGVERGYITSAPARPDGTKRSVTFKL